ncbi:uncharacterized protein E0L32_005233 [Thyridium curvatum]|uniref:Uncharacterized protein n=1 Tax=Thyridium curvatum TaxID=1093900 RepID=A0A507BC52_9PEZI|nr:uncharacterized protein E0L32_005233 [Thyridium curvatum]TPX14541.1 hypothetical protein E0L32_005233 [Thyridium curvatum]
MSNRNPFRNLTPTESDIDQGGSRETLREKAVKKVHGEGANPSQLGDPVSLKAETSETIPTDDEQGSRQQAGHSSTSSKSGGRQTRGHGGGGEKLREKAARKLHGPDANPSMLGDPISLRNESGGAMPREAEEGGMGRRGSKL